LLLSKSGLPDGLFLNQKSQYAYILEGLRLENVDIGILRPFGIFLRTFGIFYDHLVHFGIMYQEKSGNTVRNLSQRFFFFSFRAVSPQKSLFST
jgi:hypothetical protein